MLCPKMLLLLLSIPAIAASLIDNDYPEEEQVCDFEIVPAEKVAAVRDALAEEFLKSAVYLYDQIRTEMPKMTLYGVQSVVEIGTALDMSHRERSKQISTIFAEMINSEITSVIRFTAKYEMNRLERWTRDLQLIGVHPHATLRQIVRLPFDKEEEWSSAHANRRMELILEEMKQVPCSVI